MDKKRKGKEILKDIAELFVRLIGLALAFIAGIFVLIFLFVI